jgi:histone acetyltransferase (RNA polymerase elongator complex component)
MSECKHGLKQGCFYCHNRTTVTTSTTTTQPVPKKRTKAARLSEQMNDRMTTLKQRLRQIRGE